MRDHEPSQPLIAIHRPKTGGTSVREFYEEWFGDGFLTHYKQGKTLPPKHDLSSAHSGKAPTVVYGHFNKFSAFGIEAYYPEVKQFTTILRDPFDRAVSRYFHLKRESIQEVDLRDAWLNQLPEWSMLRYFPQAVTMENYKHIMETYFIEVGIAERMETSLQRIAAKLGRKYRPLSSKRLNASHRNCRVPYELAAEFAKNHPLDYAVYSYALSKYIWIVILVGMGHPRATKNQASIQHLLILNVQKRERNRNLRQSGCGVLLPANASITLRAVEPWILPHGLSSEISKAMAAVVNAHPLNQ